MINLSTDENSIHLQNMGSAAFSSKQADTKKLQET